MRRITSLETAAAAALLLGVGLALAPETRADAWPNGMTLNGGSLNGQKPNGVVLNGREINPFKPQGRAVRGEAADAGALRVRAVRLPGGRTLLPRQR